MLGGRVGVCPAVERRPVVGPSAVLLHLHGLYKNGLRVDDGLHGTGHCHFYIALEEQDAFRQRFDMAHLLDCDSLEQLGQWFEALIVQMKMKVHVLMNGLELIGHRRV